MLEPRGNDSFPLLLSAINTVGYLYATVTPAVLDPHLRSHVRFPGGRTYPHAWLIAPTSLLVLLGTFLVAQHVSRNLRAFAVGAPLLVVVAFANLLIFRPEVPHMHLVNVTSVWLGVVGLWTWIHDSCATLDASFAGDVDRSAALEYLKENASFYRTIAFGLMAGALTLLIAAIVALRAQSSEMLSDPREAFLMDQFNTACVAIYMLLLLFGPILEALRAWHRVGDLFLAIKSP
jgi:hypothetical protein